MHVVTSPDIGVAILTILYSYRVCNEVSTSLLFPIISFVILFYLHIRFFLGLLLPSPPLQVARGFGWGGTYICNWSGSGRVACGSKPSRSSAESCPLSKLHTERANNSFPFHPRDLGIPVRNQPPYLLYRLRGWGNDRKVRSLDSFALLIRCEMAWGKEGASMNFVRFYIGT